MVSLVFGGTTDRITARILFKVLRAGSGTPARYSSMLFGVPLPFVVELRLPDFTFFMRAMLQEAPVHVHACPVYSWLSLRRVSERDPESVDATNDELTHPVDGIVRFFHNFDSIPVVRKITAFRVRESVEQGRKWRT